MGGWAQKRKVGALAGILEEGGNGPIRKWFPRREEKLPSKKANKETKKENAPSLTVPAI